MKGGSVVVPSLMVVNVKQDATNQVPVLLSKGDLVHKVREVQQCSDVGGDGFPHRNRLTYVMVEDLHSFFRINSGCLVL